MLYWRKRERKRGSRGEQGGRVGFNQTRPYQRSNFDLLCVFSPPFPNPSHLRRSQFQLGASFFWVWILILILISFFLFLLGCDSPSVCGIHPVHTCSSLFTSHTRTIHIPQPHLSLVRAHNHITISIFC